MVVVVVVSFPVGAYPKTVTSTGCVNTTLFSTMIMFVREGSHGVADSPDEERFRHTCSSSTRLAAYVTSETTNSGLVAFRSTTNPEADGRRRTRATNSTHMRAEKVLNFSCAYMERGTPCWSEGATTTQAL